MPDVNLLRDTKQPEDPKKPNPTPPVFDVTNPTIEAKPGIGGFFRNLLKRRTGTASDIGTPSKGSTAGSMSLGRPGSSERILSETKKVSRPAVIPLPEDEGGYNVNLLTEDLITTFDPKRKMVQLTVIGVAALALVAIAFFGLQIYGKSVAKQVTSSKGDLASIDKQINDLTKDKTTISDTTNKLSAIRTLIDRHVRWTRFFTQLEHYTLPAVTYGTSFNGDITGAMSLSAIANSFDDVAEQYLVLQQAVTNNDFISTFTITGAALSKSNNGDRVTFTVTFTILPELLENPPEKTDVTTTPSTSASNTNSSAGGITDAGKAAEDLVAVGCDMYDNSSDITFLPLFAQADAQAQLAATPNKPAACSTVPAATMARALTDLKTDQDKDGLNLTYEMLTGTSDSAVDTNKDGTSDYQQAAAVHNSKSASANTNTTTP